MPNLGRKYTCYSCHTKFYDLGKPVPLCPKCNADQRDSEEAPLITSHRSRRVVVEEPVEEPEFGAEAEREPEAEATEDEVVEPEKEQPEDDEDEEEEY